MRIEHKLSPAVATYAQRAIEQLAEIRKQYLTALGQAKELELQAEMVRQALGQQLAIVESAEGLPRPVAPYQLSGDGTKLIGEIADAPETAPIDPVPVSAVEPSVNGARGNV